MPDTINDKKNILSDIDLSTKELIRHFEIFEKQKQEIIAALKGQREILEQYVLEYDLGETTEYLHPVIGEMTRIEWIYFIIYHSGKHARQLARIRTAD